MPSLYLQALLQGASGSSRVKRPASTWRPPVEGEDLQTAQTALAGAQKSYIKVKRFIFQVN